MELFADKWIVQRVLGHGGMGIVYAAKHARLGHKVALKVLSEGLREHPELVTRFEREARAASVLSSAHVVKVFDIDVTESGTPYLVMELLDGLDLARLLERDGPQAPGRAVRWVLDACDAIAEAHQRGIVHRDLKPSNLFLAQEGERVVLKVLDFGIAKRLAASPRDVALTGDVAPLGTPHYMSPEQVRCAKDVDARTDVWSLGVTLFELMTGETPYMQVEASACIAAIAADPVRDPRDVRPDLPAPLVDVLMRALAKDPRERFVDAGALRDALLPFAELDPEAETSGLVRVGTGTGSAKPRLALDIATMTEEGLGLPPPPPPSSMPMPIVGPDMLGPRRTMRPALLSTETVPPASFEDDFRPLEPRGKRLRQALVGLASAGAIAAAMLLPKCVVGDGAPIARDVSITTTHAMTVAAPVAATEENVVVSDTEHAAAPVGTVKASTTTATDAAAVRPAVVADASSTPANAASARAKASRAAVADTAKARPAKRPGIGPIPPATPSVPVASAEALAPVHGGLRGPGF